jgi:Cell wall-active antibiotics response 4TMS YvqF
MQNGSESALLAAQRLAIQDLRSRFEYGELPVETFRETLDALVLARDTVECQSLMSRLPVAPLSVLSALEPASAVLVAPVYPHRRIVAFMSQIKKTRRPWRLAPLMHAVAIMGDVQLDLSKAELPPRAKMRIYSIMGAVRVLVPKDVRVIVRSTALLGGVKALGEGVSGVIAFGHEEHEPAAAADMATAPTSPRSQIEIEIFVLMGDAHIKLIEAQIPTIGALVRDVLQAAATGMRRGLLSPQR